MSSVFCAFSDYVQNVQKNSQKFGYSANILFSEKSL